MYWNVVFGLTEPIRYRSTVQSNNIISKLRHISGVLSSKGIALSASGVSSGTNSNPTEHPIIFFTTHMCCLPVAPHDPEINN